MRSAQADPSAPLLIKPDGIETYGDIARRAAGFAHTLSGLGKPGDRVAILAENTETYVAEYYGAAGAGWIAVPLNTSLHADALAFMLRDAGARVLVHEKRFSKVADQALTSGPGSLPVETVIADRSRFGGRALSIAEAFSEDHPSMGSPVAA
ncbi:MAG: AMP-binding protein, partial [Candidatus Eisenbacteria bacterium]|nr:AMP-binding protein [Candidatus Eisenbacteria bacterium]